MANVTLIVWTWGQQDLAELTVAVRGFMRTQFSRRLSLLWARQSCCGRRAWRRPGAVWGRSFPIRSFFSSLTGSSFIHTDSYTLHSNHFTCLQPSRLAIEASHALFAGILSISIVRLGHSFSTNFLELHHSQNFRTRFQSCIDQHLPFSAS